MPMNTTLRSAVVGPPVRERGQGGLASVDLCADPRQMNCLSHDFAGREIACEASLSGRTKNAPQRAADLRTDTGRVSLPETHPDALDGLCVSELQQEFARQSVVRARLRGHVHFRNLHLRVQVIPTTRRKIEHAVERHFEIAIEIAPEPPR